MCALKTNQLEKPNLSYCSSIQANFSSDIVGWGSREKLLLVKCCCTQHGGSVDILSKFSIDKCDMYFAECNA